MSALTDAIDKAALALQGEPATYGGREDGDPCVDVAHATALAEVAIKAFLEHALDGWSISADGRSLERYYSLGGELFAFHESATPEVMYGLMMRLIETERAL